MGIYAEKARELFKQGYNCSQAVAGAFCDKMNLDFETAVRLSSSFGGGMGRMREVCGAVSGMFMVAGMMYGYSSPQDFDLKKEHYKLIQALAEKFREKNHSIVCRELLGLEKDGYVPEIRTDKYYKKRPCAELVYDAAEIIEEYIEKKEKNIY